jgi:hypothetical protein
MDHGGLAFRCMAYRTGRRTATVVLQRGGDRFGVLDCEMSVMQEHLDSSRYLRVAQV